MFCQDRWGLVESGGFMERNNAEAVGPWVAQFDGIPPLVRHRALLWQFITRNVELRHKGSHLGLAWPFLTPLLMLGLYVFVFGYVFGGKAGAGAGEPRVDYALGVFIGLILFHFIGEVLGVAPTVIVGKPNFVKKSSSLSRSSRSPRSAPPLFIASPVFCLRCWAAHIWVRAPVWECYG